MAKLLEKTRKITSILKRSEEQLQDEMPYNAIARQLADIIHYTVAIAAINDIDLTKTIFDKDKKAAIKYQHERDLESFLKGNLRNIEH